MKTTFKLVGLAIIIVLSSCGSSNMVVLKRKYNTGYYVDFNNKSKNTSAIASVKQQENKSIISEPKETSEIVETGTPEANQQNVDYPVTASNDKSIYIASSYKAKAIELAKPIIVPSKELNLASANKSKFSIKKALKINHAVKKSVSKRNTDDLFILEVILCFFPFINLIAIYLKDGKQITANFWIDLILDLLFFFPGIIFALLVVLDIISLA